MIKRKQVGDIDAPIEDLEVPFGLKILVVFMLCVLVGLFGILLGWANQTGLLVLPIY